MCDRESASCRWAYFRDFGNTRLLVVDSRAARVLADDRTGHGRRAGVELDRRSLGRLLRPCRHREHAPDLPSSRDSPPRGVERGPLRRPLGSVGRVDQRATRRAIDLEHWAAFNESFERLCAWLRTVRAGGRTISPPPRSCYSAATSTRIRQRDRVRLEPGQPSTSSCARHSGTLYLKERRIVRVTGSRAAGVASPRLPGWPAFPSHRQAGAGPQSDVRQLDRRASARRTLCPRDRATEPHEDEDVDRLVVLHRTDLALETLSEETLDPREGALDDAHAHG